MKMIIYKAKKVLKEEKEYQHVVEHNFYVSNLQKLFTAWKMEIRAD
jgi:hypothetical protein